MKTLILDDSQARVQQFADWFGGMHFQWASTANEAFSLVLQENFDLVFLDFELGFDQENGGAFTRQWKKQFARTKSQLPTVVVHTSSDFGASIMMTDLRLMGLKTIRMPFYNMSRSFIYKCLNREL